MKKRLLGSTTDSQLSSAARNYWKCRSKCRSKASNWSKRRVVSNVFSQFPNYPSSKNRWTTLMSFAHKTNENTCRASCRKPLTNTNCTKKWARTIVSARLITLHLIISWSRRRRSKKKQTDDRSKKEAAKRERIRNIGKKNYEAYKQHVAARGEQRDCQVSPDD